MNRLSRRAILTLLLFCAGFQLRLAWPQTSLEESGERETNRRQPPDKIFDAVGIEPGMTVADVGAGHGRLAIPLAKRVGPAGKVYAEDIDEGGLRHIRDRAAKAGLDNVETVHGDVVDPMLPKGSLDRVLMVLTYHHLDRPVELLRNLAPSLKPGALVAVVDPDPEKDPVRTSRPSECTSREKIEGEAGEAGYELVRVEDFLRFDAIYILRLKAS